ncbi:MAG TPA: hypothetical protein ENK14_11305 [Caldithrix sp.]|nr:hypothetical protein [Caldithrix sp.]
MKILFSVLLSFLLFVAVQPVYSQGDITVDLRLFNTETQVFYVGDIDPAGLGNAPTYFDLTLTNTGDPQQIILRFELRVNGESIAEAESDPFTLPTGTFVFTNNQLNTGTAVIPGTTEEIELKNYSLDFDRVENLKSQILATGKLPSGSFEFWIGWQPYQTGGTGQWVPDPNLNDNILTITNPTTLEPLYPGNRVSENLLMEVPSPYPYFLWQSDASLFNLTVIKKYPGDASIQDVLSHEPVLKIEGYPQLVFQYPTDSSPLTFYGQTGNQVGQSVGPIRMLEPGATYYWFVQAVIQTVSNDIILNSDVYQFKVASGEQTPGTENLVSIYLQQILGDQFDQYMQLLDGFSPTGNLYLNGAPVDLNMLAEFISKLNNQKIEIQNITVE